MELSDAERTRLKEQRRRRGVGDSGEVEPSAQTLRGGAERDEEERGGGERWGGGGVFQSRTSWEQQVRLRWRLCK